MIIFAKSSTLDVDGILYPPQNFRAAIFNRNNHMGWGVRGGGGGGEFCGNYLIIFSRTVFMVGEMEQDGSKEGVFTRCRLAELQLGV